MEPGRIRRPCRRQSPTLRPKWAWHPTNRLPSPPRRLSLSPRISKPSRFPKTISPAATPGFRRWHSRSPKFPRRHPSKVSGSKTRPSTIRQPTRPRTTRRSTIRRSTTRPSCAAPSPNCRRARKWSSGSATATSCRSWALASSAPWRAGLRPISSVATIRAASRPMPRTNITSGLAAAGSARRSCGRTACRW